MGTVEDANTPALRKALGGPPQEVVLELLGAGLFESVHLAASLPAASMPWNTMSTPYWPWA